MNGITELIVKISTVVLVFGLSLSLFGADLGTIAPSSEGATQPETQTAPARPQVKWLDEYRQAVEQAKKDDKLLLVVYMENDSPACQAFENLSLTRSAVKEFLVSFTATKIDIASSEGRKAFAETGAQETPLTMVIAPDGELLDSIPGCIIPASSLIARLGYSLDYRSACCVKTPDAQSRWKAVQNRLKLSTRAACVPVIDELLKLPDGKLPEGVTAGKLHLARGMALMFAKPEAAEKDLKDAMKAGAGDPAVEGSALLELVRLSQSVEQPKQAYEYCRQYIKSFPNGPDIGSVYYTKAVLEFQALGDEAAAGKTLEQFIREYPDEPKVVSARQLLEMIVAAGQAATTTSAPTTSPASNGAEK